MGIRVGTRLEQLLDLRRQITVQIELEIRDNPDDAARLGLIKAPSRRKARAARAARAAQAAKAAAQARRPANQPEPSVIRAWAARQGIHVGARGRIPHDVVDQYAAAHPQETA